MRWKWVDDLTVLEIVNLVSIGISSYNHKQHVPSDIPNNNFYINSQNTKSQEYLNYISKWTIDNKMKLNIPKSNMMIVNFTMKYPSTTRLYLDDKKIVRLKTKPNCWVQ